MSPSNAQTRLIGGRYRLEESVGRGGMGTVWRGHDELLGRAVAIKEVRFPPEVGPREQSELRERTLREARATARLSHPNVVTTYDVVEEDGRPWIVMELLDARSLSEILRTDGPLPPNRVAEVGLQMLDALEVSHRQGVVHRDVKPGNVLITTQGRAVLTDFGIATMSGDPSMTSTGVVLGSPAYMSPERARGQRPGPEADLWSLGATLYAAVEGRPPYERDNALGTLTAVISEPVDPPKAAEGPLADAILRLLEKEPSARPSIDQTRALLRKAAADRSSATVTLPVAAVGALDRGGRTQALPVDPTPAAAAAEARPTVVPPPAASNLSADRPERVLWEEDDQDLPSVRRSWTAILVGLTSLLLLSGLAFLLLQGDGTGNEQNAGTPASKTKTSEQADASESPKTSESPTETAAETPSSPAPATSAAGGAMPAGYRLHKDQRGFAVAVPEGWTRVVKSKTAIDFREPGGFRYLRIDESDNPKDDAVEAWLDYEPKFAKEVNGYQRIRIDPVDYRDYEAADWEFTYGNTHVLNRGMNTGEKGYALYWSTPKSQWNNSRQMFDVFAQTFRPASGDND